MELKNLVKRSWSMRLVIVPLIAIFAINIHLADGYSGGAPSVPAICESMKPSHGVDGQTSPSPYLIKVDKTSVNGGEKVIVTIVSGPSQQPFKGFLLQARSQNFLKEKATKGKFLNEIKSEAGSPDLAQVSDCSDVKQSSMTHTSSVEKKEVQMEWVAPNEDGEYVMVATVVENFSTFWAEKPSEVIKVKRSADVVPETTTLKPVRASPEVEKKLEDIYKDCGDSNADIPKGCFGLPSGCIGNRNCQLFATYRMDGDNGARFEVTGKSSSYVAVGISKDSSMGEDTVIGCRLDGRSVVVAEYFNTRAKSNRGVTRTPASSIISHAEGSSEDGYIMCKFNVKSKYDVPDATNSGNEISFDLANEKIHLLLSRGTQSAKDYLGRHPTSNDRGETPSPLSLAVAAVLQEKSPILIQLHGCFMIFAWLLCASTGMFTARYYKQTYADSKPCGVAFWFMIHRMCMALTVLLTIAAFVIIFVEVQDITPNPTGAIAEYYHPILGFVLTGLAILQVMIAFCRCGPSSKHRYLFNWFHWLVGNTAHIVGIACIFLANDLSKSNLQGQSRYWIVLVAFVALHVILHIVMSIHTLRADKRMEIRNKKRAVLPGPMKMSGLDAEAPGTGFRSAVLAIYFLGAAGTASALVYFFIENLH